MFELNNKFFAISSCKMLYLFCFAILIDLCHGFDVFQEERFINSSELCIIPITPSLFNWEKNPESVNEIEYSARISNSPDLPYWLQYTYDGVSSTGFIYGIPPENVDSISLDVIAWNHYANYSARMLVISLKIVKTTPYPYTIELKIDSMNVKDLCNLRIMNRIVNIFTKYLNWTLADGRNIQPVFLASAVELGENRIPLRPGDPEGVVVHFASDRNFSKPLRKLEEEVLKLPKLKPCPRDMKRTSMERYFRSQNVLLDWCSFRLRTLSPLGVGLGIISNSSGGSMTHNLDKAAGKNLANERDGEAVKHISENNPEEDDIFHFKTEIPDKSYGMGIIIATVIPGTIGGLVGFLLLALLWNDRDEDRSVFKNINYSEPTYRSSNEPDVDIGIITRDHQCEQNLEDPRDAMHTPLPPQYGETHPNGSPALIYAV